MKRGVSSGESRAAAIQRARTIEPRDGMDAPASRQVASIVTTAPRELRDQMMQQPRGGRHKDDGQRPQHPALPEKKKPGVAKPAACGRARARSDRADRGHGPGSPYLRSPTRISSTATEANMEIGSGRTKPAAEKSQAPGRAKHRVKGCRHCYRS